VPKSYSSEERLSSWKSIAAFLGRDERTAQRWERHRKLPVHRVPGQRGTVFAYRDELVSWMHGNPLKPAGETSPAESIHIPQDTQAEASRNQGHPSSGDCSTFPAAQSHRRSGPRQRLVISGSITAGAMVCIFLLAHGLRSMGAKAGAHGPESSLRSQYQISNAAFEPTPAAHDLYLKGRFYWEQRTSSSLSLALQAFTQATKLNPDYAEAYAGAAETYELMPEFSSRPLSLEFPKGLEAARTAVRLDPRSADAHRTLAFGLFYWEWKTVAATSEFERAIQLDPSNPETHHWYANALLTLRHMDEARHQIQLARELNPASESIYADQILIDAVSGVDPEICVSRLRELEHSDPQFASTSRYIADILFYGHRYAEWVAELEAIASQSHDELDLKLAHAAREGWQKGGERALLESILGVQKEALKTNKISPIELVNTYFYLGDYGNVIRYLQAAIQSRDFQVLIVLSDPTYSILQTDKRFLDIRASVESQMNASENSEPDRKTVPGTAS